MRYDSQVIFYGKSAEEYDPETGTIVKVDAWLGQKMCSVHDLSTKENVTTLGRIDAGGLALYHKGRLIHADVVETRGKRYRVKSSREVSFTASYVVEEMME